MKSVWMPRGARAGWGLVKAGAGRAKPFVYWTLVFGAAGWGGAVADSIPAAIAYGFAAGAWSMLLLDLTTGRWR